MRLRILAMVVVALLLAACGGDGESSNDPVNGAQDSGDDNSDSGSDGTDSPGSSFDIPEIDPSSMPPAGEAHVEVDGQTFIFRQADMLEGPFMCDVLDERVTINFQSDGHDLLFQGAVTPDNLMIATITVVPEDSDDRYSSSGAGGQGAVATEGSYALYVGRFDKTPKDDLAAFEDVGEGRVAVTCP